MPAVHLKDRTTIAVDGAEAEHFLQNLITTDLDKLARGEAKPGALLSPQGKILFDFLVSRTGSGFRLDCRTEIADDFLRRLTLYKLRAKVTFSIQEQGFVAVSWQTDSVGSPRDSTASESDSTLRDVRFPAHLGVQRQYGAELPADATEDEWTRLRIDAGIAESGSDYALGDAFPHDVLLDQTEGVGFRKGCYIGQEVVSRMHHRGTARRRVLIAKASGPLPAPGTNIAVNGRSLGTLGSVSGNSGLAIVRIDRVKDAIDAGQAIEADGVALALTIPVWASFAFPEATAEEN